MPVALTKHRMTTFPKPMREYLGKYSPNFNVVGPWVADRTKLTQTSKKLLPLSQDTRRNVSQKKDTRRNFFSSLNRSFM